MTRGRALAVLALFGASLLMTLTMPWCTSDTASAQDFVEAARTVAERAPSGAVVLVHPPWRDDAVAAVRAASIFAEGVLVTSALSPRHGEPLPPLVILRDDGASPLPRALRRQVEDETDVGAVRIGIVTGDVAPRGAPGAARDLSDGLASAEVEVERADSAVRCSWSPLARRQRCEGMPEWVHVGVEELPIGGRTERCTWAHPITDATLVVRFPQARLLGELDLELALTDGAADNTALAPVRAQLLVDGAPALDLEKPAGKRGFARASALTGGARDAAVELRLTTPNDGQRHTCFRLTTRAAP